MKRHYTQRLTLCPTECVVLSSGTPSGTAVCYKNHTGYINVMCEQSEIFLVLIPVVDSGIIKI